MHPINESALIAFVFSYYHEVLKSSDRALNFLRTIGFDDPDLVNRLYLGFSDRTLGQQLPEGRSTGGAAVRGALRRVGLLKPSGHEYLRGCVIFPLQDTAANIIGGYAFSLYDFEKAHRLTPVSWVLNDPSRGCH
jgi:DNA primase